MMYVASRVKQKMCIIFDCRSWSGTATWCFRCYEGHNEKSFVVEDFNYFAGRNSQSDLSQYVSIVTRHVRDDSESQLNSIQFNSFESNWVESAWCGIWEQTCHSSRIQSETPAIALPNAWHALETFALFSEYFCPYCTNFIYVIIEQKLP